MWKLALAVGFVSSTAFAAGLIQIPDSAVVKTPTTGAYPASPNYRKASPLSSVLADDGTDLAEKLPKKLDGAPQAEYEGLFNNMFDGMKESSMRKLAVKIPVIAGVHCLNTPEAFGYKRLSENEYIINCYAGTGKKITHVAEFKMHIDFIPPNCGSRSKIHSVFNDTANRTRMGAVRFYKSIEKTCIVDAVAVNRLNPVSKITQVDPKFVKNLLEDNADLANYVNGSSTSKDSHTPPVIAEDEKPKKPKKSTRRQVIDDSGDEDDSDSSTPAPCVSGNVLCKSSGAY